MRTRFLGGAVCALAALAFGAPAAQAACLPQAAGQAFSPWKDKGFYAPVAGGGFEGGVGGWTVAGPASVVDDNEPFFIGAPTDRNSLQLAGGASALSPVLCAGKGYPNARMFARSVAGRAALGIEVLNVDPAGATLSAKSSGKVDKKATGWAPTGEIKISQGTASKYGGLIRLRFTSPLGSTWRVDDVQLDPRLGR